MVIKENNHWKKVYAFYIKADGTWTMQEVETLSGVVISNICQYGGSEDNIPYTLSIMGPSVMYGTEADYFLAKNSVMVPNSEVTWSIVSGAALYAVIDNVGKLTILPFANNSTVVVGATYKDEVKYKTLKLTYLADASATTTTETDTYETSAGTVEVITTTTEITDASGNTTTATTVVETTTGENGETTHVETNEVINSDGSSTSTSNTVILDESGNTMGSASGETNTNSDGSYSSTNTTFDSGGSPTNTTNASGDTEGNVNTQGIEYESGSPVVTGYTIDTSNNPESGKTYSGDGVNTEYYAFDVTRGFVVNMHFTVDCSNKPAGQDENHHNVLTAKRASPSPWYGFQIRQSNTNKYVQLGTQFSTGSNVNTKINPAGLTGSTAEYNLRILYNPTAGTNTFICKDLHDGTYAYTSNSLFPDIEDLKYIKVTIGYAMDANGDPFRYSNIDVKNFSIQRLADLYAPEISCDGEEVSISCDTKDAVIYFRLNQTGDFVQYTSPIAISEDTIVEAYARYYEWDSATVVKNCHYEPGTIHEPVIYCDGIEVSITCQTAGADIYYKLNQSGDYGLYEGTFTISADTLVEAYSKLGDETSTVVSENCIYTPEHDYANDYFTFRVKSAGTICWSSLGSEPVKTLQYSVNGGAWSYLVPSSTGATDSIEVSDGDVVRFKGSSTSYASSNVNYMGFSGGTAEVDVEGNIMSLVYGDNFIGNSALTGSYNFCSLLKATNVVSAENLILPSMVLTPQCYRALFANSPSLEVAPALPATTLAAACYRYMFQDCSITTAPDLLAPVLAQGCYEGMFNNCLNLTYIKCMATNMDTGVDTYSWTTYINTVGTFIKDANTDWLRGANGIPTKWVIVEVGVKKPAVSCDGLEITLDCDTQGASIYYRLNEIGEYALYAAPISISADTVIETYSQLGEETSPIVKETCIYDDGIEEPVIYCDGEYVTISCTTGGASIYYRFDQSGTYTAYYDAIIISADTICEAYSEIDGRQSEVVSANCIYDETLKAPIIECNGTAVTISCHSVGADVYYRLNEEGTYGQYSIPIVISADTIVEAYSERDAETSAVVSALCIYDDTHDYSLDYLTFDVLTDGTIRWDKIGSVGRTIQYSINDGAWTPITASTASTISVTTGDKVRFKGSNNTYATDKNNYSGFDSGGTATYNIEGNIMSLVYGDNFVGNTALTGTYNFCSIFKQAKCVSAENLILPATTLNDYCYRAMFSKCPNLVTAPALPATTLSKGCYWYMFEECSITTAPDLLAETLVAECYGWMFIKCASLNYIKCLAKAGFSTTNCKQGWVQAVAASGTFVKDSSVSTSTWGSGQNGIPTGWLVYDDVAIDAPEISCDGYNNVTITCDTQGAAIYYKVNGEGNYATYSTPIVISADTVFESYSELNGQESRVVSQTCEYISDIPFEASNRNLSKWNYNNQEVTTPYSVNAIDGHSSSYAKGTFNFETSFALREAQPTYLWFQHADQSAAVYIDNVLAEKHWGGYTAFFVDVTDFVHSGTNHVKVAIKNNEGNSLAPAAGDFNFNATLGNVKLYTSPYMPAMNYGYDGFHVTSDVATSSATIYVRTSVPTGATVTCEIDDGTFHYGTSGSSTGDEMVFRTTISNPRLWNGTLDPHLYNITLEIIHDGELYHRYQRPYGLRFYKYVINDTTVLQSGDPYTGFLLNGSPYLLRGCCMHDDIDGEANALSDADYTQTFSIIRELGCNFLRLAHYPHPRETYDWCDRLGIVVQTEAPCVNKMQSTMPSDYYEHLNTQYDDMVNQHFNHPCIFFWGLSNETTTDDKAFANEKINGYISRIRALDSERLIGYVMAQGASDPSAYYNNPNADWFGCNIYEGWYSNQNSNNPSTAINTRIKNLITNKGKAIAYSEYGCGGTQRCHSDDYMTTTTRGNYERHDIEYMMWLHEGHIAAIKNYPQLMFTAQWQLFDIAVANRNEGYTVCLDGETTSIDESLRRLNDKGLVERDHRTKKDPFYLYKAWWNTIDKFVHICGKDYTKTTDRVIKCYTNDANNGELALYVNNVFVENATVTDNIATFTSATYSAGDTIRVVGANSNDTLTF